MYKSQKIIVILLNVVKFHSDNSKVYFNVGFFLSFQVGKGWMNECLFATKLMILLGQ